MQGNALSCLNPGVPMTPPCLRCMPDTKYWEPADQRGFTRRGLARTDQCCGHTVSAEGEVQAKCLLHSNMSTIQCLPLQKPEQQLPSKRTASKAPIALTPTGKVHCSEAVAETQQNQVFHAGNCFKSDCRATQRLRSPIFSSQGSCSS